MSNPKEGTKPEARNWADSPMLRGAAPGAYYPLPASSGQSDGTITNQPTYATQGIG